MALRFLAMGYHTFLIEYSVGERAGELRPLRELAEAVRIIRRRAGEWHIEPEHIAVLGFSAGGHLAASLATLWHRPELGLGEDCRPDAAVLCYPVITTGEFRHAESVSYVTGGDEQLTELLERQYKYVEYLSVFQGRKSFSKTDREATFMRMKEDHMKNGQLKAGYNVQIGVENEYIIGVSLFPNPTDVNTLIPFLERFRKQTGRIVKNVIADAGYESEENYRYLKEKGQTPYIKPQNYELAKTRKYQQDIYRVEHMTYDEENDLYICPDGRSLDYQYTRNNVSANGYDIHKRVYQNESCAGCPHRDKCHKSKYDRREIKVSQPFDELRRESYDNIVSEKGVLLRMNRSIQVEGAFGVIKQDMSFRRFLTRGKQKTETQFFLIAISFNIQKLWNRRQADRTGMKLFHEEAA